VGFSGAAWIHDGASWTVSGASWPCDRASWAHDGASWTVSRASWAHDRASWSDDPASKAIDASSKTVVVAISDVGKPLATRGPPLQPRYRGRPFSWRLSASLQPGTVAPIAYGFIGQSGSILHAGTANYTITNDATGEYTIDILGVSMTNVNQAMTVAVPFDTGSGESVTLKQPSVGGDIGIIIWEPDGTTKTNSDFSFVVFKSDLLALPQGAPPELANPPGLRRYGDTEEWSKRDPIGFEAWRKKYVAWQLEQTKVQPFEAPADPYANRRIP